MRVLLANPPWEAGGLSARRAGSRWPHTYDASPSMERFGPMLAFPFFLAYTAAVLERDGHDVLLIDALAEMIDLDAFLTRAVDFQPDFVLMETSTPSFHGDTVTIRELAASLPATTELALAGPHVSVLAEESAPQCPEVRFFCIGEYENTVRDLVACLEARGDVATVPGLKIRQPDGSLLSTGPGRLVDDLDSLPWPARHHLPMESYTEQFGRVPVPNVQMLASRGCPFKCSFCVWPQVMYGGRRYRVRDWNDVIDEMEHVIAHYDLEAVFFDDDTFNIGDARMREFARLLRERQTPMKWAMMGRLDTIEEDTLARLAEAGLCAVKYGVESGAQELVDECGKNLDLEQARKTVAATKRCGVGVHLTFTLGLPGETWDTVRRTRDFILELDPDSIQVSLCTPFPGTQLWHELKQEGLLIDENWDHYDGNAGAVVRSRAMTADELETAMEELYHSFNSVKLRQYLRQNKWRVLGRFLTHPLATTRQALAFAAPFLKRHRDLDDTGHSRPKSNSGSSGTGGSQ